MRALVFDSSNNGWETSKGFEMAEISEPFLDGKKNPKDGDCVVLKMKYAGVCGSDKGIWNRAAFKDLIHNSLEKEDKQIRILGHELCGEVIQAGSLVKNVAVGQTVSGDSHITCGECYQCQIGQNNVCTNELILGISVDGVFAEYVKLPAKNLFVIDENLVRPEIAAIMDPFGNAMNAVSKFESKGQTVAVFGAGPIGLFAIAILKHLGAKKIIAIDINQENLKLAKEMGASEIFQITKNPYSNVLKNIGIRKNDFQRNDFQYDEKVVKEIIKITDGVGVDVAMEMAGPLSSVLNCLNSTRRGGQVVLFGIKDGDFTIPKFSQIITKGLTLHGVIGRRIFETWEQSYKLLCDKSSGVQEKIWNIILRGGKGTIINFSDYNKEDFKKAMVGHPKIIFKF